MVVYALPSGLAFPAWAWSRRRGGGPSDYRQCGLVQHTQGSLRRNLAWPVQCTPLETRYIDLNTDFASALGLARHPMLAIVRYFGRWLLALGYVQGNKT